MKVLTIHPRHVGLTNQQVAELHEHYALEFGTLWIAANETAVSLLSMANLKPSENKMLGSFIAVKLCIWRTKGEKIGRADPDRSHLLLG